MRRDVRILLVGDGRLLAPFHPERSSLIINFIAEGVGKSTIVTSLIKESFVSQVGSDAQMRVAAVPLTHTGSTHCTGSYNPPRSYAGKCDNVHRRFGVYVLMCTILGPFFDALTGDPDDKQHLEAEIRKAHVICVVYSIEDVNTFERIPTYWLPYFRQLGVNVPVILIGNKIDLRGGEVTNEALEDEIVPIMNEFKARPVVSSRVIYLSFALGS